MSASPFPPGHMPNGSRWRRVRALLLLAGALSCKNDALDPDRDPIASIVVSPGRLSVGAGVSAPLTVEVRDASGALLVGRKIVWATKDATIATVSSAGVVTGVRAGAVQVAATAEGKSAIVDVTVNAKSVAALRLSPSGDLRLLVAESRQMVAETLDAEGGVLTGRVVTWSSNSATVASVSANGQITALAPGGAVVTAASEGRTAAVAVTVSSVPVASVSVAPGSDEVVVTQTLQLSAVARDASGAPLTGRVVSWSTSDASKATVSSTGVVTGVATGAATITASVEGKSGTSSITVKPKPVGAVILSPAQTSVETGQTTQLTAQVTDDQGNLLTGRPITYATQNPAVATVSTSGLVTAVGVGATKISASSEGKTGSADITVTPVPVATVEVSPGSSNLIVGQTVTLAAVAKSASGAVLQNRPVAWISGAPTIASVSAGGVVTALASGSAMVLASVEGKTGSAVVNVRVPVNSVTVTPASPNVQAGQTVQLTATLRDANQNVLTGRQVSWSSSNTLRATVDATTGLVTTRVAGKGTNVTITATSEGKSGTSLVTIQ